MMFRYNKKIFQSKTIFLVLFFFLNTVLFPQTLFAQDSPEMTSIGLPIPGTMVKMSDGYHPTMINGITINPNNALQFDFIVSRGDAQLEGEALRQEVTKLMKYFLAALTIPKENLWVNLSPYERDRMIPVQFGKTEMGRGLLSQDYMLKQLTASLMYPDEALGQSFWERVYKKAKDKYGTTQIPLNTFNKIWIVPDQAVIYEHGHSAFVYESHLKVLLEEDYIFLQENLNAKDYGLNRISKNKAEEINNITSEIVRDILIPEIEKEVNEGEIFAQLRQIVNTVILAAWFKDNLKESLLGQVYVNKGKILGVDVEDKAINQKIYHQYLEAFKLGVYNYIREDFDPDSQQKIPRKYFSGGSSLKEIWNIKSELTTLNPSQARSFRQKLGNILRFSAAVVDAGLQASSDEVKNLLAQSVNPYANPVLGVSSPISAPELRRLQESQRAYPLVVATQTASEMTAFGLRGAYKRITDIMTRENNMPSKLQALRYLFTALYSRTEKEELEEIIGILTQKKQNQEITSDDLEKMKKAIKDTADALAKRIFERIVKESGIILMVRVSEGFGRDEVAESLKANEVILPDEIKSEIDLVYDAIQQNAEYYQARSGKYYPVIDAIIDVIEGTNQFVTNSEDKTLDNISDSEAGATSVIVTGLGVRALGNAPDGYVGQFITNFGDEAIAAAFNAHRVTVREAEGRREYSLKDPELYARHPGMIIEYLRYLAQIRGQEMSELEEEFVIMDRDRESDLLAALAEIKELYNVEGLKVMTFVDGTVVHGLKTLMTQEMFEAATGQENYGVHKTMVTIGGSAEGFMNLAIVGAARKTGAVGGLRVYSDQLNENKAGEVMKDHSQRYEFTAKEIMDITNLRPQDATEILSGNKLFTEEDVTGEVQGSFSFISTNGVFRQPGAKELEEGGYTVQVLDIRQDQGLVQAQIVSQIVDQEGSLQSSPFALIGAQENQSQLPLGGINLNPLALDIQIKRDGKGVPLPINQQPIDEMNIQGFIPVIINISPMDNISFILGLKDEENMNQPPVLENQKDLPQENLAIIF